MCELYPRWPQICNITVASVAYKSKANKGEDSVHFYGLKPRTVINTRLDVANFLV